MDHSPTDQEHRGDTPTMHMPIYQLFRCFDAGEVDRGELLSELTWREEQHERERIQLHHQIADLQAFNRTLVGRLDEVRSLVDQATLKRAQKQTQ